MKILFIGDIVGDPGRQAVCRFVPQVRSSKGIDFVVANGENSAAGLGITPIIAGELLALPIDVLTSGNHIYHHKEIIPYLKKNPRLLRPANYLARAPGAQYWIGEVYSGVHVAVVNLIGQALMGPADSPFACIDQILKEIKSEADIILVDMHAETTAEKMAMGWYLDGRVSAVLGTHTHIPTADERVLPGGTAYITDVGMTGPYDSVIGMDKEIVLQKYATGVGQKYQPAKNDVRFYGVILDIEENTGKARSIQKIEERLR